MKDEYKMAILVRTDLKMTTGKASVQSAHAAVEAALKSKKDIVEKWRKDGMKKVVLKVSDKEELIKFNKKAKELHLKTALITDAARTFFKIPTTTCLAIGPDKEEKIDRVTKSLSLLE